MKPVTAQMQWKGRELLCNGVCVATIGKWDDNSGQWWACADSGVQSHPTSLDARRAVNRRFKLPLDFGESK